MSGRPSWSAEELGLRTRPPDTWTASLSTAPRCHALRRWPSSPLVVATLCSPHELTSPSPLLLLLVQVLSDAKWHL